MKHATSSGEFVVAESGDDFFTSVSSIDIRILWNSIYLLIIIEIIPDLIVTGRTIWSNLFLCYDLHETDPKPQCKIKKITEHTIEGEKISFFLMAIAAHCH